MAEILCSTGAIIGKANNRDYHILQKLAGQLQCDGYEFMMYSSWYEEWETLADYLVSLGLHIPVVHADKRIGEFISQGEDVTQADEAAVRFQINCELARRIGAKVLVLHLWGGMASDQNFDNHLRAYPVLRDIADGYGLDLLVENVVCNRENPMKHLCQLAKEYPEIVGNHNGGISSGGSLAVPAGICLALAAGSYPPLPCKRLWRRLYGLGQYNWQSGLAHRGGACGF